MFTNYLFSCEDKTQTRRISLNKTTSLCKFSDQSVDFNEISKYLAYLMNKEETK